VSAKKSTVAKGVGGSAQRPPEPPEVSGPSGPGIVVLSTLFPSSVSPFSGLFIRERMFRVAKTLPLEVVSPVPWFPLQSLLRRLRPGFRPMPPRTEQQDGITVHFPRFLSLPGLLRRLDGLSIAVCCFPLMRRLTAGTGVQIIDSHFAYPDGYAAMTLGRWLKVPTTTTLRGSEVRLSSDPVFARRIRAAVDGCDQVFSVCDALRHTVLAIGADGAGIQVVPNGVDIEKFRPIDQATARQKLGLEPDDLVLVSVGGLVEGKGFHRVIEVLPALRERFPALNFLIVGKGWPWDDWEARLRSQVIELGLADCVKFLGPVAPEQLHVPLSAADLFVLATRSEGWANVLLEAMACGLPVVTTRVGGNPEVVQREDLGVLVEFGDAAELESALAEALARRWDRAAILQYALDNQWDTRVAELVGTFRRLANHARARS